MKVICAWCRREGRPGLLGEKPPLDDPSETHGVCSRHQRETLETLESLSFPGIRLLVVVGSREHALFHYLSKALAGLKDVAVIMDRRRGERRRLRVNGVEDRRQTDRRLRGADATAMWYRYVRFGPRRS